MKLKIRKDLLNEKLNIVSKALSLKNIIPVLSEIKFELDENNLKLTSSNDDVTIETSISSKDIEEIKEIGSIVIPGKYLLEIVRKIERNDSGVLFDTRSIFQGEKCRYARSEKMYLLTGTFFRSCAMSPKTPPPLLLGIEKTAQLSLS